MGRRAVPRRRRGFGGAAQHGLKALLVGAALGFAAVVVSWPSLIGPGPRPPKVEPGRSGPPPQVDLRTARLVGRTRSGRPYRITARAAERLRGGNAVALTRPTASLARPSGTWLFVRARQGTYRIGAEILTVAGGVRVYGGGGTYLETDRLRLAFAQGRAQTRAPVRGTWPGGRFRSAGGGRASEWGKRVELAGASRLVFARDNGLAEPLPRPPVLLVPRPDRP